MCGISCIVRRRVRSDDLDIPLCARGAVSHGALYQSVQRRGPDSSDTRRVDLTSDTCVEAMSAVLSLRGNRGDAPQPAVMPQDEAVQPHHATCAIQPLHASFLQWNGEVFGGDFYNAVDASDTVAILHRLHAMEMMHSRREAQTESTTSGQCALFAKACVQFFEREVEGPYAFVYYAASLRLLLFGRDPLGRRSLLTHAAFYPSDECVASSSMTHTPSVFPGEKPRGVLEMVIASVSAVHLSGLDTAAEMHGEPLTGKGKSCSEGTRSQRRRPRADSKDDDRNDEHVPSNKHSDNNGDGKGAWDVDGQGGEDDGSVHPFDSCWSELPNTGLFSISLTSPHTGESVVHHAWVGSHSIHPLLRPHTPMMDAALLSPHTGYGAAIIEHLCRLHRDTGGSEVSFDDQAARYYLHALWRAVEVRVMASHSGDDLSRPIGVLFSGGIDCTVLAALTHYILPVMTPIELINVAFGDTPDLTPDRMATFHAFEQLLALPDVSRLTETGPDSAAQKGREWRLVLVDVPNGMEETPKVQRLIAPGNSLIDLTIGTALWHAAQGRGRMQCVCSDVTTAAAVRARREAASHEHKLYRLSADKDEGQTTATTNTAMTTVDEQRATRVDAKENEDTDAVEDEKYAPLLDALVTELESFSAMPDAPVLLSTLGKDHAASLRPLLARYGYKRLGPYLNDAAKAGVIAFAQAHVASSKAVRLLRPVDLARVRRVGPARWLTSPLAEGREAPIGQNTLDHYVSAARVLLLGMGADETLGGYTRHRRAFERRGADGLAAELCRDFGRLWRRNLGRDDRVVSDSGREGRCPFLDEGVLRALAAIAGAGKGEEGIAAVCDFGRGGPGVGDKRILRRCAAWIGLGDVVRLQKRAIQFGSRIAHLQPNTLE